MTLCLSFNFKVKASSIHDQYHSIHLFVLTSTFPLLLDNLDYNTIGCHHINFQYICSVSDNHMKMMIQGVIQAVHTVQVR